MARLIITLTLTILSVEGVRRGFPLRPLQKPCGDLRAPWSVGSHKQAYASTCPLSSTSMVLRLKGGSAVKEQLGFEPETAGDEDVELMEESALQESSEEDEM